MARPSDKISARNVMHEIIPQFKATEQMIAGTLAARISRTRDPGNRARLETLKIEFELEADMIRRNLMSIARRYPQQLEVVIDDAQHPGDILELDEHDAVGIHSARELYRRAQAIRRGGE